MDGVELLEGIRGSSDLRVVPVVVLTSSRVGEDIVRRYAKQANAYLTKPVDGDEFVRLVRSIGEFRLTIVEPPRTDS
jgi:two-component system response regulator